MKDTKQIVDDLLAGMPVRQALCPTEESPVAEDVSVAEGEEVPVSSEDVTPDSVTEPVGEAVDTPEKVEDARELLAALEENLIATIDAAKALEKFTMGERISLELKSYTIGTLEAFLTDERQNGSIPSLREGLDELEAE